MMGQKGGVGLSQGTMVFIHHPRHKTSVHYAEGGVYDRTAGRALSIPSTTATSPRLRSRQGTKKL